MKINEIVSESFLFELREYINRDVYGAWIQVGSNRVYDVTVKLGHKKFVNNNKELFFPENPNTNTVREYLPLYKGKWVRVVTYKSKMDGGVLGLEGTFNALKNTKRVWMPTVSFIDLVTISLLTNYKDTESRDINNSYEIPRERIKFIQAFQ